MPQLNRHTLRTLGFALIIVGFLLIVIALASTTMTHCPANGCPPESPWMGVFVLFSGIALVIMGIVLLVIARRMKPKQQLKE